MPLMQKDRRTTMVMIIESEVLEGTEEALEDMTKLYDVESAAVNKDEKTEDDTSSTNSFSVARRKANRVIMALIMILGMSTCAAFLTIGIKSAKTEQVEQFDRRAEDLVNQIRRSWQDYLSAAAWVHGRCKSRTTTRAEFYEIYEYLIKSGLDFLSVHFDRNTTHAERSGLEEETRQWVEEYWPTINYSGFVGLNYANSTSFEPRLPADYYLHVNLFEPVDGDTRALDLDLLASGSRRDVALEALKGSPALSEGIVLTTETMTDAYSVLLMHPGFNLSVGNDPWPRDAVSILIRIPDLLTRAAQDQAESSSVYLFDNSVSEETPAFLGATTITASSDLGTNAELTFLPKTTLEELCEKDHYLFYTATIQAANREWMVAITSINGTYEPDIVFVVLGGVIIFIASSALACWVHTNTKRMEAFNRVRTEAEAEKAALILENARQATKAERELNDFIAHEVRNPVAAAMSACSFVKAAVNDKNPLRTEAIKEEVRDDVNIIDNSLRFVNDLLRNMLDMHRSANKQLKVHMTPTDLLHDVFEPVQALLPQRDANIKVLVECPAGLVVLTDRLRLKQVCLNLGRNSVKFVDKGFIRFRAEVVDSLVQIFVEDSGPGIPVEKRDILFSKFQESLDSLSQGTGIGLFLCQNLVELMEGEIRLDESYHSGVKNCPGTRFIINLQQEPVDPHAMNDFNGNEESYPLTEHEEEDTQLPESISVLFVDDDPILRKLFSRTVRTVAPGWKIREASNGETALRLVDEETFDLVFVDMYMASVEKQLLGTETVRELRKKGIDCRICGLSANDKESEFLDAGANVFTFKPFPCEARALTKELIRVLFRDGKQTD